jgi:hypothetical protein
VHLVLKYETIIDHPQLMWCTYVTYVCSRPRHIWSQSYDISIYNYNAGANPTIFELTATTPAL